MNTKLFMIKKFIFPGLLIFLGWAFFISPNFEQVAAGVAILLFGMILLEEGFNAFVKGPLQKLLQKSTDRLYKSLGIGFLVTAVLQSSSLISVVTISFISAGLIGFEAGIGIIFGANLGTTATTWLVAFLGLNFKVSSLALPLLAFGIIFIFQKSNSLKAIGRILAGLGFFFLGIYFMKEGFDAYQDSFSLSDYNVSGIWGLVVFTLIGIAITFILQSSSASMALILTALAAGQIDYSNSLALAIGANIGTTITAIIGAFGSNVAGKRLAGAHFIFNVTTGVIALILIVPIGQFVNVISDFLGVETTNYVIKLSIFHTLFNVLGLVVMVPLIQKLIRHLERVFVDEVDTLNQIDQPVFLNDSVLAYPQTALKALLDESKRLFEQATFNIVSHGLNLHRKDIQGSENLREILKKSRTEMEIDIDDYYYHKVKLIYSKIIKYASLAQGEFTMSENTIDAFTNIKLANRKIVETIKDIRGLRNNVNLYMNSENTYIQSEYERLRHKVSKVLREIYATQNSDQPELHLDKLEHLKQKSANIDVMVNGSLDTLIREHKISSIMATSLANDSANVANITKKLIETAELLYIQSDTFLLPNEIDLKESSVE